MTNDWHEQPFGGGRRNTDVAFLLQQDRRLRLLERRVEVRALAQRRSDRLDDEREVGEVDAL